MVRPFLFKTYKKIMAQMNEKDKAEFERWLKEWSHQLGSHWSIYTFCKALFKHAIKYARENK